MLSVNHAFCGDVNTLYHYWKHCAWDFLFAFSAVTLVNHSHPVNKLPSASPPPLSF